MTHGSSSRCCERFPRGSSKWNSSIASSRPWSAWLSPATDVVLLDLGLPDSAGLETFERTLRGTPTAPIVVISGLDDEHLALEAVRAGAQDYLVKGRLEGQLLARVIRYAIERKHAEAQIWESERRFRQLTENMHEVFFVQDSQFRESLYISPAYEEIWGRSCQSLQDNPQSFMDPIPEEDRARLFANIAQAQAGTAPQDVEFRVVRPDGTTRWVLARSVPVRNELGEVYRIAGVVSDVTDRKRAEESLRVSEQRARTLFDTVNLLVLGLNAEGRVDYVNPYFLRLTGYTRDEVLGQVWTERFLPQAQQSSMRAVFLELLEREFHPYYQNPIVTKVGEERMIAWNNTVLRDPQGRPTGTLSIGEDITERQRSEQVIRQLTLAVEQSPAGVLITDTTGTIQYVNRKFTELTGYSANEAVGHNPRLFKSDKTPPELHRELWDRITAGEQWRGMMQNRHKDGHLWWNSAIISPIRDSNGTVTHFLAMQQDVTAQRQLEDQFRQAQKMEAVGRLAGGVAHDFNNLLTVISSYSELLIQDLPEEDEARRSDLGLIRKAATDAAGLTRQLLAFSRQQVLELRVVDLNTIVTGAGKMLQRVIGEDITLAIVLAPNLGWVKADAGQIEQVIMNLAVNARDAMPDGGRLTIETANADLDESYSLEHPAVPPGRYVQIVVTDTGVGMTDETKRRIFEPFFTTKELGKGTGLGLATVYGIVKQSNGFVWVYSEPGQGATFKVYLPQVHEAGARNTSDAAEPPARGTETVLLAEDAAPVRNVARQVLERYGYTVLEAPNGRAALDIVAKHHGPIQLLLTDVVMPEMSGRQLADQLTSQRPEIKVLFVSGYTDDSVVRHGVLEAGIAYLQKPFTPDSLARKVRAVLDGT